ncbi:MAG: EAL domain-containing protein [Spirulinaceae cyanobacterium RM2_2_10]|nr:EAL domain-containing protein [Spirulinaceae cyanobacterium SM2_1_0]NJO19376.1 EAL domain-containing protein [Spirulinaceae cyanobacterium RM2_2_10]
MAKILIIEDDAPTRANLAEIFTVSGYEAIATADASRGLELAIQEQPDAIFCDLLLPDRDGYTVLTAVRDHPRLATTPFVIITGRSEREWFRQAMLLGADDYLTKPFTAQELLSTLYVQLQKRWAIATSSEHYHSRSAWFATHSLRDAFLQAVSDDHRYLPLLVLRLNHAHELQQHLQAAHFDALFAAVIQRVAATAPALTIVSLDGERLALLASTIRSVAATASLANQILTSFEQVFRVGAQDFFLTASIGMASYPRHATGLASLLASADRACQIASRRGGNHYQVYAPDPLAGDRLLLATELHYALDRQEFVVHYQPRIELASGRIVACEALVRWQHPQRGSLAPAAFIPLAEETGLISAIGERVLRLACQQALEFQAIAHRPLRLAVNFSGRQFSQPDFLVRCGQILRETQFDPGLLEVELTESVLIQDRSLAQRRLSELRQLGIQIAIDDFGTGYSSLSYLQQFPVDVLKLDRRFTGNLNGNAKNAAIAIAVIQMAHSLNLRVVAEGVETDAELAFFYQQACHEIQGYCFSQPLPASEFCSLLAGDRALVLPAATLFT